MEELTENIFDIDKGFINPRFADGFLYLGHHIMILSCNKQEA